MVRGTVAPPQLTCVHTAVILGLLLAKNYNIISKESVSNASCCFFLHESHSSALACFLFFTIACCYCTSQIGHFTLKLTKQVAGCKMLLFFGMDRMILLWGIELGLGTACVAFARRKWREGNGKQMTEIWSNMMLEAMFWTIIESTNKYEKQSSDYKLLTKNKNISKRYHKVVSLLAKCFRSSDKPKKIIQFALNDTVFENTNKVYSKEFTKN